MKKKVKLVEKTVNQDLINISSENTEFCYLIIDAYIIMQKASSFKDDLKRTKRLIPQDNEITMRKIKSFQDWFEKNNFDLYFKIGQLSALYGQAIIKAKKIVKHGIYVPCSNNQDLLELDEIRATIDDMKNFGTIQRFLEISKEVERMEKYFQ